MLFVVTRAMIPTPLARMPAASSQPERAQSLRFVRWLRTSAGLRMLCQCTCRRAAVVPASDQGDSGVNAPVFASSIPLMNHNDGDLL